MDEDLNKYRYYIYKFFKDTGIAPLYEEIAVEFNIRPMEVFQILQRLADAHFIVLHPSTHRILFANPFSNIRTTYRVTDLRSKMEYFANCGWDAIAFHFILEAPIEINTIAQDNLSPLTIKIVNNEIRETNNPNMVLYFTKPASKWWDDIIDTCTNNMHYFSSKEGAENWAKNRDLDGRIVPNEVLYGLSELFYRGKLGENYSRPSSETVIQVFEKFNLTDKFWRL